MVGGKGLIKKLLAGGILAGAIYFNSVQAQENYQPKYNTKAHKMLMIEDSSDNIPNNTFPTLQTLDNLIDNSKKYIVKKENYTEQEAKEICKKIYHNIKGISLQRTDSCYRRSLMYLAIAEENKLPIYGVRYPHHVFIRWDSDGKHDAYNQNNLVNKGDFNFETITGKICTDTTILNDLLSSEDLKQDIIKNKIYLQNLNKDELVALAYLKGSYFLLGESFQNKYKKSLELIEKSLELSPNDLESLWLKGSNLSKLKKHEQAIESYTKAINLNPLSLDSFKHLFGKEIIGAMYYNRCNELSKISEFNKALEDCNRALELDFQNTGSYLAAAYSPYLNTLENKIKELKEKVQENKKDTP